MLQGEGEVKLIQRLVNPFDGSGPSDSYAIIGSDSDLFIMALLQESFSDLWILPEGEVSPGSGSSMEGFTTTGLAAKWEQRSNKATVQKVGSKLHSVSLHLLCLEARDDFPAVVSVSGYQLCAGGMFMSRSCLKSRRRSGVSASRKVLQLVESGVKNIWNI